MTNALRFVFLELGRFNKRISDLETKFEKWVYLLMKCNLNTAKEDAERIGLEKGLAEAQMEMARKMLAAGMPVEQIAEITGLAVEQLHAMQ